MPKKSPRTPEEVKPLLIAKLHGRIDTYTAMSWFPFAAADVVPDLLEELVKEGVLERLGEAQYRRRT